MNAELFFFYLYGAGSPLSIFVQNLCLAVLFLVAVYRLAARRIRPGMQVALFAAFLLSQFLAVLFSTDTAAALKGVRDNWALTAGFIAAFGLSKFSAERLSSFQSFLSIGAMIASVMSIIQFLAGTDFQRQRLWSSMPPGSFPSKGFFTHHLTFAGFMGMVFFFLAAESFYGKRKSLHAAGAAAALLSLLLSQSRGYLIVLVACLPVLFFRYSKRRIAGVVLVSLATLFLIFLVSPSQVKERALSLFSMKNGSTAERVYLLKSGLEMAAEKPLFGWGPGCYAGHSEEFRAKYEDRIFYPGKVGFNTSCHTHNSYLMVLVETGLVGLAAYLAFLISVILAMARSANHLKWGFLSLTTYFLLGGLFEYNIGDAEVAGFFAFMAGLFFALERPGAGQG